MKILMIPGKGQEGDRTSGISAVVHKYVEYLEKYHDVEFVKTPAEADLIVGHAGVTRDKCDVAIIHGLYWTGDYDASLGEYMANADIVESVRSAYEITVPSEWVQKNFQRDMHVSPTVIYHGVEFDEWVHNEPHEKYVLWNKNRPSDVCSPLPVNMLAMMFPDVQFVSTFSHGEPPKNMRVTGKLPHDEMKKLVQHAGVYLSLVKETFGIGILEAMASGCPVLGWDYGGNQVVVKHGVNGYLAEPDNYQDLANGLRYCIEHAEALGKNSMELAKKFTWKDAVDKLYIVLEKALEKKHKENTVSVIIPLYNYAHTVERTVDSVCAQAQKPHEIIIVDDGSKDNPKPVIDKIITKHPEHNIIFIQKENGGVATARNLGVFSSTGKYICCIDADDAMQPKYLETCTDYLEKHPDVYTAYTKMSYVKPNGETGLSSFPSEYNYDGFLRRLNQVSSCNVTRREVWERLGGQRDKYSPVGAGSEDAEMWLRAGAMGYGAALASEEPLFVYSWQSGLVSGNSEYREADWLSQHPWTKDLLHPFASLATPANISHKVFQYDIPKVSVVIPVGPGHEQNLRNALDSLEAQTFRRWEVVVVYDNGTTVDEQTRTAFPFPEYYSTGGMFGPATARNIGVKYAKSDIILFLDADDALLPDAIQTLYDEYIAHDENIIYSDYIAKIQLADEPRKTDGLIQYDKRKKCGYYSFKSLPYDCEKAQKQPIVTKDNNDQYLWTNVTAMISKRLHEAIGGFDESLRTLEDADYHWRLARYGACYTYIDKPLYVVDMDGGIIKNEKTAAQHKTVLRKLEKKYKGVPMSPCGGCGGKRATVHPTIKQINNQTMSHEDILSIPDDDFILVNYLSKNIGTHPVVGAATRIDYGYRQGGQQMLVHREDARIAPHLFEPVIVKDAEREMPDAPELINKE